MLGTGHLEHNFNNLASVMFQPETGSIDKTLDRDNLGKAPICHNGVKKKGDRPHRAIPFPTIHIYILYS